MNDHDASNFKAPSLQDVGVRAPYMHDGRLATLADVIEHYRDGIQPHPDFDPASRGRFAFRCILESSVQALPNPSEARGLQVLEPGEGGSGQVSARADRGETRRSVL